MKRKTSAVLSGFQRIVDAIPATLLVCVFTMMPFFVLLAIGLVKHVDIFSMSTAYNDEVSWFHQAVAVAELGKPLGYWGYNGMHAPIGTFGAWGPVAVWFQALFLKPLRWLFPDMGVSIYVINNLLWACGANLLFVVWAKPKKNNLIALVVTYAFLFVNHCYMLVAMSETVRFSMSVILAGAVAYLFRKRTDRGCRIMLYGVVPLMILAFMGAYIMFAAVVPIWLYAVYQNNPGLKNRKALYVVISAIVFVAGSLAVYFGCSLYTSPYVTDGVTEILSAFGRGIGSGFEFLIEYISDNLSQCGLKFILSATDVYGGFFVFYLPLYYGVGMYLILSFLLNWKKMEMADREIHVAGAFVMAVFLAAFIVLYSTYYWILARGINIALVFSLYLLCMKEKPVEMKAIAAVSLLGIVPFVLVANNTFIAGRAVDENAMDYRPIFSEHIQISQKNDPWENTIACYGDENRFCLDLPVGTAINSMMNMKPNQKARYAMVLLTETTADELTIEDPEQLIHQLEENHDIRYRDENLVLMVRTAE